MRLEIEPDRHNGSVDSVKAFAPIEKLSQKVFLSKSFDLFNFHAGCRGGVTYIAEALLLELYDKRWQI